MIMIIIFFVGIFSLKNPFESLFQEILYNITFSLPIVIKIECKI